MAGKCEQAIMAGESEGREGSCWEVQQGSEQGGCSQSSRSAHGSWAQAPATGRQGDSGHIMDG